MTTRRKFLQTSLGLLSSLCGIGAVARSEATRIAELQTPGFATNVVFYETTADISDTGRTVLTTVGKAILGGGTRPEELKDDKKRHGLIDHVRQLVAVPSGFRRMIAAFETKDGVLCFRLVDYECVV